MVYCCFKATTTHLCSIVELSKQVVECFDQLLGREGGGEGGEVDNVREQDGHVVVLLNIQLPAVRYIICDVFCHKMGKERYTGK